MSRRPGASIKIEKPNLEFRIALYLGRLIDQGALYDQCIRNDGMGPYISMYEFNPIQFR